MLGPHKAVPLVVPGHTRQLAAALSRSCHPRSYSIRNDKYDGAWIFRRSGNTTTSPPFSFIVKPAGSVITSASGRDATAWAVILYGCCIRNYIALDTSSGFGFPGDVLQVLRARDTTASESLQQFEDHHCTFTHGIVGDQEALSPTSSLGTMMCGSLYQEEWIGRSSPSLDCLMRDGLASCTQIPSPHSSTVIKNPGSRFEGIYCTVAAMGLNKTTRGLVLCDCWPLASYH